MKDCRIRQGLFDRWYIFHDLDDQLAWSGTQWVPCSSEGLPTGSFQVCNFLTQAEAILYALHHSLQAKG